MDRRNRFVDLHLHVHDLRSRVVKTPEQEARLRATEKLVSAIPDQARGRSHSALRYYTDTV